MKKILLINFILVVFTGKLFSQGNCPCCNTIIQSPVVSKPMLTEATSVTCSTLVVNWKGAVDQSFQVRAWSRDPGTGQLTEITSANIVAGNNFTYTATLPVAEGSYVSWSIQAEGVVNNRSFYSYPLRSDREYLVPGCDNPVVSQPVETFQQSELVTTNIARESLTITNDKLAMYPNPVSDILYLKWDSEYKGNARITVMNASGTTIKTIEIKKEQADYMGQVTVSSLTPGLYFINVRMKNGKSFTMKFFKN